jgi:FAD/FMN-containing dehydrogenase
VTPFSVDSLARSVRGRVDIDPDTLARVGHDGSHLTGRPAAAVAPHDVEDVVELVRWARREGVPLVPRGAGTSLDGESVPTDGAVVVDLAGWNAVLEVDRGELWARVGPGVVNLDLQRALEPQGAFFPPNPGSWTTSTVGGNFATNASGPRSFRYGSTRQWVRAAEVVLGTGERLHVGGRTAKRSIGPDLLQLLIGSEGTLGIVTELTVRLAPRPALRRGLVVAVPEGCSLGAVATRLAGSTATGLAAVEYLDRACAATLREGREAPWPDDTALLLLEVEASSPTEAEHRIAALGSHLRASGITGLPTVMEDADELWTLRGESSVVLDERVGQRIREDVAVPLGAVDALLRELDRIGEREGVPLYLFAHLGEGSLHPNYVVDPASPTATRIRTAVLSASLRLGGTISAEHGIGRLKIPYLASEVGPAGLRLLRALKEACDPDGILNPGKIYPLAPP